MLNSKHFATAILILASYSSAIQAQDILGTTGQTVRSYNYVEGFYIANLEDSLAGLAPENSKIDTPILIRLSVDLADNISLNGKYLNQSFSINNTSPTLEADAFEYELGIRYRRELKQMQNTDWIAGIDYGLFKIELDSTIFNVDVSSNYFVLYFGGRRTLADRIELELGIRYEWYTQNGFGSEILGEAALVYRLAERLDIALGATNLTGANSYGLGVRYTWK